MQNAYHQITGKQASVFKTQEFVDLYALESWGNTQNLYNPMREEYWNTSFLCTDVTS